jgi:hypothetical protein
MLRSIKQLYGDRLGALDGAIGHVKDFYFDDRSWVVRYLVAETGTWLPGRQVLISPHTLGNPYLGGRFMPVNLTRKQIEDSPSIESHKPLSRQYEEDYYRYYGWPNYWQGDGLWGMSGLPVLASAVKPLQVTALPPGRADAHLCSTQAVNGYHLKANDGIAGFICDFMMDDASWEIGQLVIKTGHRFTGKAVQIPAKKVTLVSYEESTVYVNLTKVEVEQKPAHDLVAA